MKGESDMFFNSIKKKIRNKNILWSLISILVICFSAYFVMSNGFSSDTNWRYGFRFSDIGIPLPNWLVSCLFIVLGLIFVYMLVSSVRDIFTNKTYNSVIESARLLGDVAFIDTTLESMQKSRFAKGGDLRYDNNLFFYMKGTEIHLFPIKSINNIQPIKKTGKSKEFYVEIHSQEKIIRIDTKEENLLPLANDILMHIKASM